MRQYTDSLHQFLTHCFLPLGYNSRNISDSERYPQNTMMTQKRLLAKGFPFATQDVLQ